MEDHVTNKNQNLNKTKWVMYHRTFNIFKSTMTYYNIYRLHFIKILNFCNNKGGGIQNYFKRVKVPHQYCPIFKTKVYMYSNTKSGKDFYKFYKDDSGKAKKKYVCLRSPDLP
jgi:hypothetical protein